MIWLCHLALAGSWVKRLQSLRAVPQVGVFQSAYGDLAPDGEHLVTAMLARQEELIDGATQAKDEAMLSWATSCRKWTLQNAAVLKERN